MTIEEMLGCQKKESPHYEKHRSILAFGRLAFPPTVRGLIQTLLLSVMISPSFSTCFKDAL